MTATASAPAPSVERTRGFVSVTVDGQLFGVPVLRVQDVIVGGRIDPVPLSPPEVAGSLNQRGRIVTAVDLRARLALPPRAEGERPMCVIVEQSSDLFALLVDDVGDVLWLDSDVHENAPITVPPAWRDLTEGLYRLEGTLLLALSVEAVLDLKS